MCLLRIANVTPTNKKQSMPICSGKIGNLCIELFTVNGALQVWRQNVTILRCACTHIFHPLLGIDLKWWLHECTTADHVIFLWDEDFREREGERARGGPQTTSWECEIVDNYLLSKIQCLPDELELNLRKPSSPPPPPHSNQKGYSGK